MEEGKAPTSGVLFCTFVLILCLNIPFIVCDFYYANSGNCVDVPIEGFSFTLSTWLKVEGALRCVMCGLFLLVGIVGCFKLEVGLKLLGCSFLILILYAFFMLSWLVVGAVMFWGNVDKEKGEESCSPGVKGYMYALLILGFCGVCMNIFAGNKQRQNKYQEV